MKRNALLLVFGVVMFMLASPFIFISLNRAAIPSVTLPIPNGFDTLTEASKMAQGLPDESPDEMTDQEAIIACLEKNEQALGLIEKATHEACVVPIDYQGGLLKAQDLNFRHAFYLSKMEIRLAELQGRTEDQARLLTRLLELATNCRKEGLLIHVGVSMSIERSCLTKLVEVAPKLDSALKAEIRNRIAKIDRQPVNFDEVMERERVMIEQEYGFRGTYMLWVTRNHPNDALDRYKSIDADLMSQSESLMSELK